MIQEFPPSEWNSDMAHQLRRDDFPEVRHTRERRWSSCNIETEFCCFLSKKIKPLRIREGVSAFSSETRVAALDPSISNDLHHQFLDL